ncbi:hypothetical protein AKJ64_05010, partial [candidate division MSBL1 archaeon SCGC-AAA259E17]
EICVCEDIAHEQEDIRVFLEGRSYDKVVTVVDGLDDGSRDLEGLASELKKSFGCGGTVKNGHIELQGDHRKSVEKALTERGFPPQSIEVQGGSPET